MRRRRVCQATAAKVDSLASDSESLARSTTLVDEYLENASFINKTLKRQGDVLKDAHRKVLDIASSLGISRNLMNVIQRRTTLDKYLVYVGMVVVILLVLLLRHYL